MSDTLTHSQKEILYRVSSTLHHNYIGYKNMESICIAAIKHLNLDFGQALILVSNYNIAASWIKHDNVGLLEWIIKGDRVVPNLDPDVFNDKFKELAKAGMVGYFAGQTIKYSIIYQNVKKYDFAAEIDGKSRYDKLLQQTSKSLTRQVSGNMYRFVKGKVIKRAGFFAAISAITYVYDDYKNDQERLFNYVAAVISLRNLNMDRTSLNSKFNSKIDQINMDTCKSGKYQKQLIEEAYFIKELGLLSDTPMDDRTLVKPSKDFFINNKIGYRNKYTEQSEICKRHIPKGEVGWSLDKQLAPYNKI